MDRSDLMSALYQGPVCVYMNDGNTCDIHEQKSCIVDSTIVYVLYRRDDGKQKAYWLALVSMNRIEPIEVAA